MNPFLSRFGGPQQQQQQQQHLVYSTNNCKTPVPLHKTPRHNRCTRMQWVQNVGAFILLVIILAGNSSILHRLKLGRRRRSNVNYFIVHLAIAGKWPSCERSDSSSFLQHLPPPRARGSSGFGAKSFPSFVSPPPSGWLS